MKKKFRPWCSKQKKAYHRILAGMRKHNGEQARFLTLTSKDGMHSTMEACFNLLNKRIYWVLPIHFVCEGYLSYEAACDLYGEDNLDVSWSFNYIKVCTSEGDVGESKVFDEYGKVIYKGVTGTIHIIYFGIYLPKSWLSDVWFDVTGAAFVVDVRAVRSSWYDFGRVSRYCINQYTAGQDEFLSYFCSRDWIFAGAWKAYAVLRDQCKDYSRVVAWLYGNPIYYLDKKALRASWEALIDGKYLIPKTSQYSLESGFDTFMASVHDVSGSLYGFRF